MNITIAIIEDVDEIRNRFVEIMATEPSFRCLGAYSNAEDFVAEYPFLDLDVVFMDINLPGMNGIEAIKLCKKQKPKTHFIVYSVFENSEVVFEALKAGATGYLLKSTPKEKLISSIHEILKGDSPMSGTIAMKVVLSFQNSSKQSAESESLSKRENEILGYLSKGFRYKEIANLLFISVETVRTHIRNIYEKLQVKSRTEAIIKTESTHTHEELGKYLNSSVKPEDEERCFVKIKAIFDEKQPYLQEKYTISRLAKEVDFPVYVVSQTINKRFKMGFFDFINHHRIKDAMSLIKISGEKITIEGIAYQCGFCSRTSFYRAFKKETGTNPSEFLKE